MRPDLSAVSPGAAGRARQCSVGDLLARAAGVFPDRSVVVADLGRLTYRELDDLSNAVANGMLGLGIARQEGVALVLGNSHRFLASFFGCARAGAVVMPVNTGLRPDEIAYQLETAHTRFVMVDSEFVELVERALQYPTAVERVIVVGDAGGADLAGRPVTWWAELVSSARTPPDIVIGDRDVVQCLFTSGTTAAPKGVLTSHLAVVLACFNDALTWGHRWGDDPTVFPVTLPLFHTTALNAMSLPVILTGGTLVIRRGFLPAELLDIVEQDRATHLLLLPFQYSELLRDPQLDSRDLSSVRLCVYGMAQMAPQRLEELRHVFHGADVLLGSGQTECVPLTVFQWPVHQHGKTSSWGSPVPQTQVGVMDTHGALCPPHVDGEIVYRGPNVMEGYLDSPEANASAFAGGWLHSGDIGHLDDEGVVWFTDRLKDVIKSGGENVSSLEVERAVLAHEAVVDCAVVGRPHDRWGEIVVAVVVVSRPVDPEDLRTHSRGLLSAHKLPKIVEIVDALPKTATGKVQKHLLRGNDAAADLTAARRTSHSV